MSSPYFRFQQFLVWHDRSAMRVGTDGVLLGAWAEMGESRSILDIGTGCGLVALMAAQRAPEAHVVGVEIDPASARQAQENAAASPFSERLSIVRQDIRAFRPSVRFDHILCNPPYHTEDTLPPQETRMRARNTAALSFDALIRCVARLLAEVGDFTVIIPTTSAPAFIAKCLMNGLYLRRRCDVKTTARKESKRSLLTFSFHVNKDVVSESMVLMNPDGSRSADYQRLTSAFYLPL